MSREIDSNQRAALARPDTRPIYLVELYISSTERFSTNGDQVVGLETFSGADVGLSSVDNWQSATIKLRPSPDRVAQVVSQEWRHGRCQISLLPTATYGLIYPPGYMQDGYGIQGQFNSQPLLLVDGELTSADLSSDRVNFTVSHRFTVGRWVPALRIDPPLCNHLPKPGEVVVWENEKFTLEAR